MRKGKEAKNSMPPPRTVCLVCTGCCICVRQAVIGALAPEQMRSSVQTRPHDTAQHSLPLRQGHGTANVPNTAELHAGAPHWGLSVAPGTTRESLLRVLEREKNARKSNWRWSPVQGARKSGQPRGHRQGGSPLDWVPEHRVARRPPPSQRLCTLML